MIFRALDPSGDWTFGKGKNNYVKDQAALGLDILTKLKSWKGDCFFDDEAGVDYNSYLDRNTKEFLDLNIKQVILRTENVLRVIGFTSAIDEDRKYSATVTIVTVYGQTNVII